MFSSIVNIGRVEWSETDKDGDEEVLKVTRRYTTVEMVEIEETAAAK